MERKFVTKTVLDSGSMTLVNACIVIGWLPERLRGDLPPAPESKKYMFALLHRRIKTYFEI